MKNRHLADRYMEAKIAADAANAVLEEIRKEVLATGVEHLMGDDYAIDVVLSERCALDTKAVKEMLTLEQIAKVSKTSLVTSVRGKRIVHTLAA